MNARKLFSSRALALLLCLALCAALLAGCGGSSGSGGIFDLDRQDEGGIFDLSGQNAPTLWSKSFGLEAVHLPEAAFEEADARLCGLSADGSKALISCCSESYLYDLASGEKTWLIPGDEQTEEALRLNAVGLFRDLPQEEAAQRTEALQTMKGRELAKLGLSSRGAGRSTLWARDLPGSGGAWMLAVNNGNGFSLMLDTASGKFYSRLEGEYVDARGDQLLALGRRPLGELTLVDRSTGKETPIPALREDFGVISAAFLPDGGVAALLRDLNMDTDHGQECLVALRDARGKEESYTLGKIRYGMEPGFLFCLNEDTLVLRSAQAGVPCDCVLRRSHMAAGRGGKADAGSIGIIDSHRPLSCTRLRHPIIRGDARGVTYQHCAVVLLQRRGGGAAKAQVRRVDGDRIVKGIFACQVTTLAPGHCAQGYSLGRILHRVR